MNGTLSMSDGRYVLRFERRLHHPLDRVWRAISEPGELAAWFPGRVDLTLEVGAAVTFSDYNMDVDPELLPLSGEVLLVDPPRRLAFSWGDDLLRFELEPSAGGCRLVFTHAFDHRTAAARSAAGWNVCLDALEASLDGTEPDRARWPAYFERYRDELGADGWFAEEKGAVVLRVERLIEQPAASVWAALTEPDELGAWLGEAELDPVVGGRVRLRLPRPAGYEVTGIVTRIDPRRVLAYTWTAPGEPDGEVTWQLIAVGEGATLLLLTHTVRGTWTAAGTMAAWHVHLTLLGTALGGMETWPFPDLRFVELRRHYLATAPKGSGPLSAGAT